MNLPHFSAAFAPADSDVVAALLARNTYSMDVRDRIKKRALSYVDVIRKAPKGANLEDFMQEYSLSTREGLALMVLAEALLRVPDDATQDALIEEKIGQGDWHGPDGDEGWLLMAASWGIGLSAKIVNPGESPGNVLKGLVKRLGSPVVRSGTRQAMGFLGHNFVLGETIEDAVKRARKQEQKGFRYSYDMLGEGARTYEDAKNYFDAYANAIAEVGRTGSAGEGPADRPGISVKLSALHPRYFLKNRDDVMDDLVRDVIALAQMAKAENLNFTMDAEEADRLEISLDIFRELSAEPSLGGWDGLGLAVQAYQKRAPEVVTYIDELSQASGRKFMVRLVKGAYWDTEIKRAQERGLYGFPVFTRKPATDLCYLDCARLLLGARPRLFPQFATHNALTMATILELGGDEGFEFQRLHGMGEILYEAEALDDGLPVRIYAPVGGHKELLAYLVRRMLENAANSSFVAQVADPRISNEDLLEFPQDELRPAIADGEEPVHPLIRAPQKLYPLRPNSSGVEFGIQDDLDELLKELSAFSGPKEPLGALIDGETVLPDTPRRPIDNPARLSQPIGEWVAADHATVDRAMNSAAAAFPAWNETPVEERAEALRRFGDLMDQRRDRFVAILAHEAGRTTDDGIAEVREAVDFCRYYAQRAEELMVEQALPSPAGETDFYHLEGRGVWVAIAPWNFPLAIFVGQIVAALVTGNTVVAKPAPQTPYIGTLAVEMMHEAGIPAGAINLVLGEGETGGYLTAHPALAGVVFTGSTATAKRVNVALAERDGPIVPLIAETGGINAMIVDSTALAEQVADDVIGSAFRSAGQRCSALRMLYVQDDVADTMLEMIRGAAAVLKVGDPTDLNTDVGPVIDQAAADRLKGQFDDMARVGKVLYTGEAPAGGTFFPPHMVELPALDTLKTEAFGPLLHVARFKAGEIDRVIEAVRKTGYGLTFGIHSRLEGRAQEIAAKAPAGNVYINRNMVGAVVGVQPFGGRGLSGTGPKAGGPLYLTRFCEEKVITENTAAAGGNASLIALSDE